MSLEEDIRRIDLPIPALRSALIVSEGLEEANALGGRFTVKAWGSGIRFDWNPAEGRGLEDGEISVVTVDANGSIIVYTRDGENYIQQTFTPPPAGIA